MKQVFASGPVSVDQTLALDDSQAHHLFDVLRTSSAETVRVIYNSEIYLAHPVEKPYLRIFSKEEAETSGAEITLCAALIKADKWEWMLQKAAELGVSRIIPFVSRNTVVKVEPNKLPRKMERWNSILLGACRQCNRVTPVVLEPVSSINELKSYQSDINLCAYEKEESVHFCQPLQQPFQSITMVIGPEGGFTPEEADRLENEGFELCSLGNRILRAETAACYVLSAIDYQCALNTYHDHEESNEI